MAATPSKELTNKQIRAVRFGFYTDDEVMSERSVKVMLAGSVFIPLLVCITVHFVKTRCFV